MHPHRIHLVNDVAHSLLWLSLAPGVALDLDTLNHLSGPLLEAGASGWAAIPEGELLPGMGALYLADMTQVAHHDLLVQRVHLAQAIEDALELHVALHPNAAQPFPWSLKAPTWRAWRRAFRAEVLASRETEELEQALAQAAWLYEREREGGIQLRHQLIEAEANLRIQAQQLHSRQRALENLEVAHEALWSAYCSEDHRSQESPFHTLAQSSDLPMDTGALAARLH